jgi:hypothetical protein
MPIIVTAMGRSVTIWYRMRSDIRRNNTRYGRLKAIGAGLILVAVGLLRLLGSVQAVTHWTGQPMFSWGLIAAGSVCIVSALIASSWITKAAGSNRARKAR